MATQIHEVRTVSVSKANGHGFQIDGGEWLNISRFANPNDAPMPSVGETVNVHLDAQGFIRRIDKAGPAAPREAITEHAAVSVDDRRQTLIVRENALAHAVNIVLANRTAGSKARVEDVLACAEKIEA